MEKEKIRRRVDCLLAGERRLLRLVMLAPVLLKALSAVLFVLAVPQIGALYYSYPVLAALYIAAAVLLRVLVCCAELLRDRWLVSRVGGVKATVSSLLAGFSLSDVLRACVLGLTLRLCCLWRITLFFAVPVLFSALTLAGVGSGVSGAVLVTLAGGNILLFAAAGFFCSAALYPVRCAVRLSCFEQSDILRAVRGRLLPADFAALSRRCPWAWSAGLISPWRTVAGLVYYDMLIIC